MAKAVVNASDFEGQIRGIILMNPMMPDAEVAERVARAAAKTGVRHEAASLAVERQGAAGTISRVRVRYRYTLILGFERGAEAAVTP